MKFVSLFLFLIIVNSSNSDAQWYSQNSGTDKFLYSVFFVNESTGWACGFETILKTTDCGTTWTGNFLFGNHKSIFFTDELTGWICGDNGRLYRTANGGTNWEIISSGVTTTLNKITFLNSNTGVIAGNNKVILKTTDGGNSWNNINNIDKTIDIYSVKIISANTIVATANESYIYRSADGGNSWDTLSFGMPNPLLTVDFINENTGWVSGCCGMYLKTTNAGQNWTTEIYLTLGFSIHSLKFINDLTGWAAGDAGYILRTTDGGNQWDSLFTGTARDLHSIYFVNKDTGIAVGHNGTILKTINGGGPGVPISVQYYSEILPDAFTLFQNYPNPFNPSTTISFELHEESLVSLKIYDARGIEVSELINEKIPAGKHSFSFYGKDFPSGIYFYRLTSGDFTDTKSMILIK